jgi:hypothetical protein
MFWNPRPVEDRHRVMVIALLSRLGNLYRCRGLTLDYDPTWPTQKLDKFLQGWAASAARKTGAPQGLSVQAIVSHFEDYLSHHSPISPPAPQGQRGPSSIAELVKFFGQ